MVRSVLRAERPDVVWIMTDPRFWGWFWSIENEIRPFAPIIYYHVWDNYPPPTYNKPYYESNDVIATISKVTHDVVKKVAPDVENIYLPHAVNTEIFKRHSEEHVQAFKESNFGDQIKDKMVFFWNNRNARRKQSGSLIFWFKKFLDIVGHDKACLIMHTAVNDPHGQDLHAIIKHLDMADNQVLFSQKKISQADLAMFYNIADCTVNISDAEGFGLSTLESLACETPIIATMTGGLQEQVTDGKEWFGIGIEPTSRAIIGSQDIPWIYEDRLSEEIVVKALLEIYNKSEGERRELGKMGRSHVLKNYNFEKFTKQWNELFTKVHEDNGSWSTRKNYKSWTLREVK